MTQGKLSRLHNALACQAFGDALGDPFEFQHRIDPKEVAGAIMKKSRLEITDDTQMAYFTLRALRQFLASRRRNSFTALIRSEYVRWYKTQIGVVDATIPKCFYKRQAPGMTCMDSLGDLYREGKRIANEGRGCGSVMRILPLNCGVLPDADALKLSLESARVTHDHVSSDVAVSKYVDFARVCRTLGPAAQVQIQKLEPHFKEVKKIEELGSGFYALEAVLMAGWAVATSGSYEELLVRSIAHPGDSDSVAAIAGSLWGLMMNETPPPRYLNRIAEWPQLKAEADALLPVLTPTQIKDLTN